MSAQALQRMLIRVMFDPSLLEALRSEPEQVMGMESLSTHELTDLLSQDPRAFRTDSHRSSRHLQALLEEYPVSVHHFTQGNPGRLLSFFSSARFHDAIQQWTSIRKAFERYLVEQAPPEFEPLISLEGAIATSRHSSQNEDPLSPGHWRLGPSKGLVQTPSGLCAKYSELLLPMKETHILEALKSPPGSALNLSGKKDSWALIEKNEAGELEMGEIPESLAQILLEIEHKEVPHRELVDIIISLGADHREEAEEVLQSLRGEGLLVGNDGLGI